MKQITIIGCGAVGALYGLRLHTLLGAKHVCFVCDSERKKRYEKEGLFINEERAPFRYVTANQTQISDLVIIATKNHHLEQAIELIKGSVGPGTAILSLLNGIDSENRLIEVFGKEHVLYGFAVGLNSTHIGNTITYTKEGKIVLGEHDNQDSERLQKICSLFEKAGIAYTVPEDIHVEQWNKFMLNTTYNTLSSLLEATYGDLDQAPIWMLAQQISKEVQAVARRENVILPDELIEKNHAIITSLGFEGKTSMCQDLQAKRPTENSWFCKTVIRLGEKHQIPTPTCRILSALVEAKEHMNLRLASVQ